MDKTTKNTNSRILIFTNMLLLITIAGIVYKEHYIRRIYYRFNSHSPINSELNLSDQGLLAMNNSPQPLYFDITKNGDNNPLKILFLGNSIAFHAVAKNIGWNQKSGMAASKIDNDYVHLLLTDLAQKMPSRGVAVRVANLANFERNPNSLDQTSIDSLKSFHPNIIIFQLGENVMAANLKEFEARYLQLIAELKTNGNVETICTTPFFPSLKKNEMVATVALKTDSFMVDLSNLTLNDNENYVINEKNYKGNKTNWNTDAIGLHPGDKGMRNISRQLLIIVNAILSRRAA